jgi:hypothetical protein
MPSLSLLVENWCLHSIYWLPCSHRLIRVCVARFRENHVMVCERFTSCFVVILFCSTTAFVFPPVTPDQAPRQKPNELLSDRQGPADDILSKVHRVKLNVFENCDYIGHRRLQWASSTTMGIFDLRL